MSAAAQGDATLQQLATVPGVVGSFVFDGRGEVLASAFPPVFDASGLRALAERLSADGYFQEWLAGEHDGIELRYRDGHVLVRTLDGSWLLVLCTAQTNAQLLAMSLTQVTRRLRAAPPPRAADAAPAAPAPVETSPQEKLRALVSAELGGHAAQALEILNAAGPKPKDLFRAAGDVEKLVRLFIDKKKADELGRRMREVLGR